RKRVKKSIQEEAEDQKDDNEVENEEDPDLKSQELPESSIADRPNPLDQGGMAETHDPNNQPLGQQRDGNIKAGGGGGSSEASVADGPKASPAAQGEMTGTQDPKNQTLVTVGGDTTVKDKGVGGGVHKVPAAFEPSGKQDSN
uniref:Uncharacterized protein n=1 Tax=Panagrolaimus sp. PS1159 TaxID=55785 RepID=A0AC35FUT8_9BILA